MTRKSLRHTALMLTVAILLTLSLAPAVEAGTTAAARPAADFVDLVFHTFFEALEALGLHFGAAPAAGAGNGGTAFAAKYGSSYDPLG